MIRSRNSTSSPNEVWSGSSWLVGSRGSTSVTGVGRSGSDVDIRSEEVLVLGYVIAKTCTKETVSCDTRTSSLRKED